MNTNTKDKQKIKKKKITELSEWVVFSPSVQITSTSAIYKAAQTLTSLCPKRYKRALS